MNQIQSIGVEDFPTLLTYLLDHHKKIGSYPVLSHLPNPDYVKVRDSLREKKGETFPKYSATIQHAILAARMDLRVWVRARIPALPTRDELTLKTYKEFQDYVYDHQFQFGWKPLGVCLMESDIHSITRSIPKEWINTPNGPLAYTKGSRVLLEGVEIHLLDIGTRQGQIGVLTVFEDPGRVFAG